MALQLLEHTKKAGDKIYRYYSIAEPYREGGKNKKRVLVHLGALDADQVHQIRLALRLHNDPGNAGICVVDRVECSDSWRYLDLAVFHELWKEIGLSSSINAGDGDVDLARLLEILVLNRVTEPASKLGVTRWYPTTALERMIGVPASAINESRMYRCLPGIAHQQERIEQHLFRNLVANESKPTSLYFYDLTSSYFEGSLVEPGAYSEHSKDHRPDRLQVMLGLLINEKGVPFSWDLFPGNQGEAPTLIDQLTKFKKRFRIQDALLVFDRGFLSHDNLNAVESAGYHYLTGLKSPQIQTILSVYPQDWMDRMNIENAEETVASQKDWHRFDETGFYRPLGVVNQRRTVLLFDCARYRMAIAARQARIDSFKEWMHRHNAWLATFKKDAERTAIENDVRSELARRNLEGVVLCELHEYVTENDTFVRKKNNPYPSQGYSRRVRSFQVVIKEERNRGQLDGVFALITSPGCALTDDEMILAYRQKHLIENAFREMKSILKLRPWFVYKEEHVRAHYTICVLAYALERVLDLRLQEGSLKGDGWTLGMLKEQLARIRLVALDLGNHHTREVIQKVPNPLAEVLKTLGLQSALKPPKPLRAV